MSGTVNKVILVGRLGDNPKVLMTSQNIKIVKFSLATETSWKDKNSGETKKQTEWHNIVVTSPNLSKLSEMYLKKGSKVYIEGRLKNRTWQDNGSNRTITEIVVMPYEGNIVLLDTKKDNPPVEQEPIDDWRI